MPDEKKVDTGNVQDPAQVDVDGNINPPDPLTAAMNDDSGGDPTPPTFTKEQEQYIGSWLGRMVSKQFEEKVLPVIEEHLSANTSQQTPVQPAQTNEVLEKFNTDLSQQMFTDPYGAFQKMMNVYAGTKKTLSQSQKTQADKIMLNYSKNPYYKEMAGNIQKISQEAISNGYPPEAAVEYAYQKARGEYLENKHNPQNLDLLSGGSLPQRSKKKKLPERFKTAFERDKAQGLFKDEADYIAHLSPAVKMQYDL